ncbi:MAG: hypothetical protein A3E78_01660 [Alphaproteobacteria bacterium RIFCSPHIGHO2_12_FULL_63_12]|nr:MAG: hypothetical protein A3E78_01660 [Alphaproteobacteria bacterium RIFCSPHIGHO2_12_FULL_63_12]
MTEFTIGRLSAFAGANNETVRFYEKIGLMASPARTAGGRRVYDGSAARRLRFIRRARGLGFSIDDIRSLLGLGGAAATCEAVHERARRHRDDIRAKINDLKRLDRRLTAIIDNCRRTPTPDCALIETLTRD